MTNTTIKHERITRDHYSLFTICTHSPISRANNESGMDSFSFSNRKLFFAFKFSVTETTFAFAGEPQWNNIKFRRAALDRSRKIEDPLIPTEPLNNTLTNRTTELVSKDDATSSVPCWGWTEKFSR